MRLLHTTTTHLQDFWDPVPSYAILSHTWGSEELTLQQWQQDKERRGGGGSESPHRFDHLSGYKKIMQACAQAKADGFDWLWVDTVCIDKTSSAELTEAINSMFAWYGRATICYAYLVDVETPPPRSAGDRVASLDAPGLGPDDDALAAQFGRSRWFTRGWTLQELLAPPEVVFFSSTWARVATRSRCAALLGRLTGIGEEHLARPFDDVGGGGRVSIARRMSWVSNRVTTRAEDVAYCMLGIFDVNLPLLYGEGRRKAFLRLQEELIRASADHTLFVWGEMPEDIDDDVAEELGGGDEPSATSRDAPPCSRDLGGVLPLARLRHLTWGEPRWQAPNRCSVLAPDPINFYGSGGFERQEVGATLSPYSMTNLGLSMTLDVLRCVDAANPHSRAQPTMLMACVHCRDPSSGRPVLLPLVKYHRGDQPIYGRLRGVTRLPLLSGVGESPERVAMFLGPSTRPTEVEAEFEERQMDAHGFDYSFCVVLPPFVERYDVYCGRLGPSGHEDHMLNPSAWYRHQNGLFFPCHENHMLEASGFLVSFDAKSAEDKVVDVFVGLRRKKSGVLVRLCLVRVNDSAEDVSNRYDAALANVSNASESRIISRWSEYHVDLDATCVMRMTDGSAIHIANIVSYHPKFYPQLQE